MKIQLLAILVVFISFYSTQAQKAPAKFGDISTDELKRNIYEKDSSASAVVLVDYGESYMKYVQERGFVLVFERLRRIKILTTEGLEYGNQSIRTYHTTGKDEKLSGLKAVTYNLENGKIVESKMKSDAVFKEKYDKNWDITNFAFPNVKVGSIIEYTYTINSDFYFNFQDWEFQSDIPTVISEYRARVPEYFTFDKYIQGYIPFSVNEQTTAPASITLNYKERSEGRVSSTSFESQKIDYIENRSRWVATDVPAFKEEPFLTSKSDYISRINFELANTKFPNQPVETYMGSWKDINKMYYESDDFGGEVKGNGFLKKVVEQITAGMTTPEQKIDAILSYVKNNISWNGSSRSFSSSILKQVFENKKGNSAEINLILASMLEKADLDVHPVLISTRDHGFIRESYPASTQFNYVICHVKFGDKEILLDATEPLLPTNILPERCLNGKGLAVNNTGGFWVPITSGVKTKTHATVNLKMAPDGSLSGDVTIERTGYEALNRRKNYLAKGEADYIKDFVGTREWMLQNSTFENMKEITKSFKEKHTIEVNNHVTVAGDVIYINPFLLLQMASNPFKLEKREYPVDFGFAKDELYMLSLTIPDGYVIDELPKSKMFALPENAAKFAYNIGVNEKTIRLTSNLSINKSLFVQPEYPAIREYFNLVVSKQTEQIVLKRKL